MMMHGYNLKGALHPEKMYAFVTVDDGREIQKKMLHTRPTKFEFRQNELIGMGTYKQGLLICQIRPDNIIEKTIKIDSNKWTGKYLKQFKFDDHSNIYVVTVHDYWSSRNYSGNINVIKLDSSFIVEWIREIRKLQWGNSNYFLSGRALLGKRELYVVYNDGERIVREAQIMMLDANGKQENIKFYSNEKRELIFVPKKSIQISDSKAILFFRRWKDCRLAMINLD